MIGKRIETGTETEVRELIVAADVPQGLAARPSRTHMRRTGGRLLRSASATTESPAWPRLYSRTAVVLPSLIATATARGTATGIEIVTAIVVATGNGSESENGIGTEIGTDSVIAIVTVILTGDGMTTRGTDEIEMKSGSVCIVAARTEEWTSSRTMSAQRGDVAGLRKMRIMIAGIRGTPR